MDVKAVRSALRYEKKLCEGHLSLREYDSSPVRCIVGALLFNAGWSDEELERLSGYVGVQKRFMKWGSDSQEVFFYEFSGSVAERKAVATLQREYDMDMQDIYEFIEMNDELHINSDKERLFVVRDMLWNAESVGNGSA